MSEVRTLSQAGRVTRARGLRRDATRAEMHLWRSLRAHRLGGWKWKRQLAFGPFFLDFACVDARLVVEVDGGQHAEQLDYDARRTAYLERAGWRVMRFWNSEVLTNRDGVCRAILDACGGEREPRTN
jgi:very-short-patch-repair endonuclease